MEKIKLSKKELQSLWDLQSNEKNLIYALGEIEYNKIQLENRFLEIKKELNNIKDKFNKLGEELQNKYGDGQINLESGEFIKTK